ncbi:alanine--glyoxylate aminotransferase family protein [Peptoniphilus sp. MSJ-1]|uniref:Alanine--glyoxylate aminotransferase family protein n=1 Tax=Peptoniphilus ovalis TaxID=2841503 RepID=A0ABS6FI74_9FIRM|nr:alanine--glyoxylate aminotransferase family protein [Peptoniphilus ovalis]MBU5669876.1 alanine--glyoxylate aminotransferase family protein [Peptoniphilus ovalis]
MKILCAGPTSIDEEVMELMGKSLTNPDIDPEYEKVHRNMEQKISKLLNTKATSFVMLGEGMIGLEAAICNLVEENDRVLVLNNGVFGAGFADYVAFYGGEFVIYEDDFRRGFNIDKLKVFLEKDHDFKVATMVHCETPSGITNDVNSICNLLNSYGILSVVDTVSGMGGEEFDFDKYKVDIAIGGSQKCISAPTGLTTITVSERAKDAIKNRKKPVPSYYMNFLNYYDYSDGFAFPYTMNENLTYAMDLALDKLFERDSINLHKKYAEVTREIFEKAGFELYAKDSRSNTLTAVMVPEGYMAEDILSALRKRGILISKGAGDIFEKVFRIGHMGNNISYENFYELYEKLDEVFEELGIETKISLKEEFEKLMEN